MSKSWGPHDIGGQEGGPIDLSEHDTAHWEWQIDAMVRRVGPSHWRTR